MTESASRVVLGLRWTTGSPEVRVRESGADDSEFLPVAGLRLNYRVDPTSRRWCVGRTPFRNSDPAVVECPNQPEKGKRACTACSIADTTFASNLHHAHTKDRATIDPEVAEHLRQPNCLYLAAFRDASIKVGTTTEKRGDRRLLEQGAWRASLVAQAADGYAVRDAEDRVTAELGVAQSVSIGRKIDGMVTPALDERLESQLGLLGGEVRALLVRMGDPRLEVIEEAWRFPNDDPSHWQDLHRYPLRLDSGQHDLECVDACGRLMSAVRRGTDDRFVADVGQLFGVEINQGDYESDELAVQDSLF